MNSTRTATVPSDYKLLKSSMELFLKYGIKSVSMDDIAKLLGISKKTIYTVVDNKKELVKAAVEIFIKEEQVLIKNLTEQSTNAIDEMVAIANQTISLLKNMKPTLTYDLKKYYEEVWELIETKHFSFIEHIIKNNVTRGIKEGLFRSNLNPVVISQLYLGMAHLVVSEQFTRSHTYSIKELYEEMVNYHLNGIINEKGRNELDAILRT